MRINWDTILCAETLKEKEKTPLSWVDYPMDPFEQDYREIISSVTFRHLQDKAQMYQFARGDYVRTRLTHSLEVSTVAKQLGIMMIYNNKWNHIPAFKDLSIEYARTIPTVLACAGLLHDMGNPPFGHEGEYVIGSWFRTHLADDDFAFNGRPIRELMNDQMKADLCNFEGNAQVIRMLAKVRFPSEDQEANVTYATISTLLKYPAASMEMDKANPDPRVHKFGYFYSERDLVRRVREKTGMALPDEPHARNPLTYLLEAADDIAYVASDIEDAVARGTVSIRQIIQFMEEKIKSLPQEGDEQHQMQLLTVEGIVNNLIMRLDACRGGENEELSIFHSWTNYLRNWLMYVTAGSFVSNGEAIMDGTYREDLLSGSQHKFTVEVLKSQMIANVYPGLADIHVAAHTILNDLMGRFCRAVLYWDTDHGLDVPSINHIDLLPARYKSAYMHEKGEDEVNNLYLRFRMVTDYIDDMTDGYALELYKKLNAISY